MVITQRSEYVDNMIRDLRLNPNPQVVTPNVNINYELRPSIVAFAGALNNATTANIVSFSDREFFVLGATLCYVKDVTATLTAIGITCVLGGLSTPILRLMGTTTTVEKGDTSISIPYPGLKIDKSTSITLVSTSNTANFDIRACIFGYYMSK